MNRLWKWFQVARCNLMQHRGEVGYMNETGPYWVCDKCGRVVR